MSYNEQVLHVLELAKEEARAFNHNHIGTEHLLLGILREESAATELVTQGVTVESIRGGIMVMMGRGQGNPDPPFFALRTRWVLVMADEEAQRMGESAISPRHLLVAILREGQGIAAQVLHDSGVRWKQVGKTVEISVTPEAEEEAITLPADFQEALQQHPEAQKGFEKLSYPKKRRFVEQIEEAGGEAARSQQVKRVIEVLQKIHWHHQW